QYQSYQIENNTARSADFDDFAYNTRLNEMNVSSSDQLFFAFEHGYKPIAAPGSAADRMLEKAKTVARRIMNDEMTELEKVRAIFSYLVSDVAYDYGIVEMTNDPSNTIPYAKCASYYLEGVFDYGTAVCDGISKAFCVLAGLEDIKCVRVTSENHAWNKLYIDLDGDGEKSWFASDATWGNQGIIYNKEKGEYLSVEDFLFTDAQKIKRGQTGRNYVDTNSNATTAENPFEYFYFDEAEDDSCDFVITSSAELSVLIKYLEANFDGFKKGDIVTVNIFIVSTYIAKDNITKTLQNELRSQWFVVGATSALTVSDNEATYGAVRGYSVSIIIHKI
ncbi:MAG: transglutaminase-like domain-containing protein, partial [Clostridia bacterium]|nr:transglutaminase-like domain-containing protein [Clostridia bacterium]